MIGQLALTSAAAFVGAAAYVSVAEQPARLGLDNRALLMEWQPAYQRGAKMQAPLALIGSILGLLAWSRSGGLPWLAGGLVLFANWPYTLLVIKPVNDRLLAADPAAAGTDTRKLIERWGKLHLGRVGLGAISVALFLLALVGPR